MRTIKFRGKRIDNSEWVYGDLIHNAFDGHKIIPFAIKPINEIPIEVIPESVGQFIGLFDNTKWEELTEQERDKWTLDGNMPSEWKGKKIFEEDTVEYNREKTKIGVVNYSIPNACWLFGTDEIGCNITDIKVIDDPELLEGR